MSRLSFAQSKESIEDAILRIARAEPLSYFAAFFTSFVRNTYQSAPVRQMEE